MKSLLLIFCGLLLAHVLPGQGIVFEAGPFEKVLKKAGREGKLVFLHLDSPSCTQCTEVATKGFSDPALTEKFAVHFISYRVSGGNAEGKTLMARFELNNPLVSLFLTPDGSLIHRFDGSTSFAYTYLKEADRALALRNQPSLADLQRQYAAGDRTLPFLERYISQRSRLKLPTDEVLDEYARQLPSSTPLSESTRIFLISQVPVLGTKADSMMRTDWQVWNEVFMRMPLDRRIAFNQTLNQKTVRRAIATKNSRLATQAAGYIAGTYGSNRRAGQWAGDEMMLSYFLGVKDTTRYVQLARPFYDTYLMPLDPDSVNRAEQSRRLEALRPVPGQSQQMVVVGASPYGRALNRGAWQFWLLATRPEDLEKALAYREDSNWIDTYARLLYKLGQREQALSQQARAVARAGLLGTPTGSFELTRQKMELGTLVPEPDEN